VLRAQRHAHSSGNLLVADNVLWLTGNGSVSSGQLVDQFGNPISAAIAPEIFRTDWQGRQLLYPTARTNLVYPSQQFAAGAVKTGCAVVDGSLAPDGSSNASLSTCDTSTGFHTWYLSGSYAYPDVVLYFDIYVKNNSLNYYAFVGISDNATGVASFVVSPAGAVTVAEDGNWTGITILGSTSAPNGFTRISASAIKNSGTSISLSCSFSNSATIRNTSFTGDGTSSFEIFALETESAVPGVYIPTTTAPVTLTDYTLAGTTVNLAQAPASGALCNWSGLYIP
jgi:hypothetical protein